MSFRKFLTLSCLVKNIVRLIKNLLTLPKKCSPSEKVLRVSTKIMHQMRNGLSRDQSCCVFN